MQHPKQFQPVLNWNLDLTAKPKGSKSTLLLHREQRLYQHLTMNTSVPLKSSVNARGGARGWDLLGSAGKNKCV